MAAQAAIRVLIADDQKPIRRKLAEALVPFDDLRLVGEASDGLDAVHLAAELQPDVILMDLVMPGMDGIAATQAIRGVFPQIRVVVLASFGDKELIVKALEAGACSFLLKSAPADELARVIREAGQGGLDVGQMADNP